MNIVFRVDAALHIGSGHVMRCLTLADELKKNGVNCIFICRKFDGNLFSLINEKGFDVYPLPNVEKLPELNNDQLVPHEHWLGVDYQCDAKQTISILKKLANSIDWLIVDHYAIDIRWEKLVRPFVKKIMLIDDLADRKHDCDLLLDQTYGRKEVDYHKLTNSACRYLLGSKYALLRNEFIDQRNYMRNYFDNKFVDDTSKRLFISMGGIDKDNCTGYILSCLKQIQLSPEDEVHIVMGKNAVWIEDVQQKMKQLSCRHFLYVNIKNVAEVMSRCNLAIGAGGTTTWERSVLGLPSIVISTADNQNIISKSLAEYGAHWYVGQFPIKSPELLTSFIYHAINDKYALKKLSEISNDMCDGEGVMRVVKTLKIKSIHFKAVTVEDVDLLYLWRNHPKVRAASFNSDEINYVNHVNWIKNKLNDNKTKLLLATTEDNIALSCIRLDLEKDIADISIYLDPNQLACGYGKLILQEITFWVKLHCHQINSIRAQIKETNQASKVIFESAGYVRESSDYLLKL